MIVLVWRWKDGVSLMEEELNEDDGGGSVLRHLCMEV